MRKSIAILAFAGLIGLSALANSAQQPDRPKFAESQPLPQGAVDLRIPVAGGTREVAATLYVPSAGTGRFPVLVTAHGASSASRNQSSWQQLASQLARVGFALLVYDPPGTGDTPGEWKEGPPLQSSADEVSSIASFLTRHPRVRPDRIGVIGWSRGGWTGPMATVSNDNIRFFVGISAPSVSPNAANIHQRGEELLDGGYSPEEVASINAFRKVIWDYYGDRKNYEAAAAAWKAAYGQPWFKKIGLSLPELATPEVLKTRSLSFYEEGTYDPAPDLARLSKPTLVMLGSADRHIPITESIAGWRTAFALSGNPDATLVILGNAGHGLKLVEGKERMTATEGHLALAALPEHPNFMPTLLDWLRRHN